MIIIQILALLAGLLAIYFFFGDLFSPFLYTKENYKEKLKDLLFSLVIIVLCASITGAIQLNLLSTGML